MDNNNFKYLEKIKFDEKLNHSWTSLFIDKTRFTFLVIFTIILAGYFGFKNLPLESMPEIDVGMGIVITTFPGASPDTIDDLITKKIENHIGQIKGIDEIKSVSTNSASMITVTFESNVDTKKAITDLKSKVDESKPELPVDANEPSVKEASLDSLPIWVFSVSGNYSPFELREFGDAIKSKLEENSLISEVTIQGGAEKEFVVEVDPNKLQEYGLNIQSINSIIQQTNLTMPLGDIKIGDYEHKINLDSRFYTIENLKNIVVGKLGDTGILYLKDVAFVKEGEKKIESISKLSVNGKAPLQSISFSVVKKKGGSIIDLVSQGENALEDLKKIGKLPKDLHIESLVDYSKFIKKDLSQLLKDGILTIFLVFIVLFLIIGLKEALVAGTAVPLVFCATFVLMSAFGQTLNFLSMFGLILSLGLLVDDAIVIISAINQYKKYGKFTTREAALLVVRDYKQVLITTTLTIIFIFSSMMFMTGLIGKFIFSIPFVITVTLGVSLVIALTINPALSVVFSGRDSKDTGHEDKGFFSRIINNGLIPLHIIETFYGKVIKYLIDKTYRAVFFLIFILVLFASAVSLPILGILKSDFFPNGDSDFFNINVELDPGKQLNYTEKYVTQIENIIQKEKEVVSFSTDIGSSYGKNTLDSSGSNKANLTVNLIPSDKGRKESSIDITERLRNEFNKIKGGNITVISPVSGPPSGSDLQFRILGPDFSKTEKISQDLLKYVSQIKGAINIESSIVELPFEFQFKFDNAKLALYDLTLPQVASFLRNVIDGADATKVFLGKDEIKVKTRYQKDLVGDMDSIKELKITNNKGIDITLRDILDINFKNSLSSIERYNQERIVTISATASKGYNAQYLKTELDKVLKHYKLPPGFKIDQGGVNEQNQKSIESLFRSMTFGMIFIVATLVLLYNSFIQSILVLITIPLSLIGVFYGLTLTGQPLSFPGLIGLVALFGIVVRNGIILFDKINQNLKEKMQFKESIIDAGISRLEPVLLTSICTILGMVPLSFSNPTWTSLGFSIIFGLSVSTLFTLLVLPSLYYLVFRRKYKKIEAI